MAGTLTYSDTLQILECGNCHITFALPVNLYRSLLKTGNWFWCPNGHQIHYYDNENTRLKAQLDQAKADRDWQVEAKKRAQQEAKQVGHQLRATKAAHTRTKKRIAKGVCPCCSRSFVNVERHMSNQHPDYGASADA